jgi:hypothetical protein
MPVENKQDFSIAYKSPHLKGYNIINFILYNINKPNYIRLFLIIEIIMPRDKRIIVIASVV